MAKKYGSEDDLPTTREAREKKLPPEPLALEEIHRQLIALPSYTPNAKRLAGRNVASAFCLIVDSLLAEFRALRERVERLESTHEAAPWVDDGLQPNLFGGTE